MCPVSTDKSSISASTWPRDSVPFLLTWPDQCGALQTVQIGTDRSKRCHCLGLVFILVLNIALQRVQRAMSWSFFVSPRAEDSTPVSQPSIISAPCPSPQQRLEDACRKTISDDLGFPRYSSLYDANVVAELMAALHPCPDNGQGGSIRPYVLLRTTTRGSRSLYQASLATRS